MSNRKRKKNQRIIKYESRQDKIEDEFGGSKNI